MNPLLSQLVEQLEPIETQPGMAYGAEFVLQISVAISLKRIADALDSGLQICGQPDGDPVFVDVQNSTPSDT